jgi:hypothetical protein
MTQLVIYPKLSTRSRRAMLRTKSRYGIPKEYRPRGHLVLRLSTELGMTKEQVLDQIQEERKYFLRILSVTRAE